MALDQSALLELVEVLAGVDDGELMCEMLTAMLQALVDAEATAHIGAEPHDRRESRTTQRNGFRDKTVTTGVGDVLVRIPRPARGRSSPACWPRAGGSTSRCTR